jgi:hypothetical protein
MPVGTLFVEGKLDIELLNSILQGNPVLKRGDSKSNLKTRAKAECENNVIAGYLRDRDFDSNPPTDFSKPTPDFMHKGVPIGWRWSRHEVENYLIEPSVVSEAMNWAIPDIEQAICEAAKRIRSYEAARWTVGVVRRALPPSYELETRPDNLKEIALPANEDFTAVNTWALDTIKVHSNRIADETDSKRVHKLLGDFIARFDDEFVSDVSNVLVWFSGKDILAGMDGWLGTKDFNTPGMFRAKIRDWVIANPERTLELLPEWYGLTEVLKS